jgi:hypothetical protein
MARVLVLGDSVANGGAQVNDEDTWPLLLGKQLNMQVLNASAGGWALANEKELGSMPMAGSAQSGLSGKSTKMIWTSLLFPRRFWTTMYRSLASPQIGDRRSVDALCPAAIGADGSGLDPGAAPGTSAGANQAQVMAVVEAVLQKAAADKVGVTILYWDPRGPISEPARRDKHSSLWRPGTMCKLCAHNSLRIRRPPNFSEIRSIPMAEAMKPLQRR